MKNDNVRGEGSTSAGGKGRNKGGGFGKGGLCVCASCGYSEPHARGVKCTTLRCPSCDKPLIREELLLAKKQDNDEKRDK
ncbi:MAG: hypothetical protein LC649_04740 [Bacteroidales bacterium]|nr:hypothetical protein [Bacteroidales bacterium]